MPNTCLLRNSSAVPCGLKAGAAGMGGCSRPALKRRFSRSVAHSRFALLLRSAPGRRLSCHVRPVLYEMLFGLLLASGLRISEALALRVRDVRLANGAARSLRVIGKGNKERLVPLPEAFGQVFGFWLADRPRDDFVFAQRPGGPPPGAPAVRAYLRRLIARAGIEKQDRKSVV